jgi:DNA-binding MarR family transcriptional regulator
MTTSSIEHTSTRDEAVEGLIVGLVRFGRTVRSRSGDWGHAVRDLTRADIVTLGVIERGGSTRSGKIATTLGVDPSVVSRQLAALHRLGLIERNVDPLDGRAELIAISTRGQEQLRLARAAMCEALAARLTDWDLAAISRATAVVEDLSNLLDHPIGPADSRFTAESKEAHV